MMEILKIVPISNVFLFTLSPWEEIPSDLEICEDEPTSVAHAIKHAMGNPINIKKRIIWATHNGAPIVGNTESWT